MGRFGRRLGAREGTQTGESPIRPRLLWAGLVATSGLGLATACTGVMPGPAVPAEITASAPTETQATSVPTRPTSAEPSVPDGEPAPNRDCQAHPVEAFPGYEPCPASFELVIDDPFDVYDPATWERSTGGFPENACRFINDGRSVEYRGDGRMRLVMRHEKVPASYSRHELKDVDAKNCSSGELRTRNTHGPYGRIQARLRAPMAPGYIQSLFTFHFYKDPWQEIDIELQGRLPGSVSTNVIANTAKSFQECDVFDCTQHAERDIPFSSNHQGEWHVYTIDWTPDEIRFFVDAREVRRSTRAELEAQPVPFPNLPTTILMNFWLPSPAISAYFGGDWSFDQLPLEAEYDWFRYYRFTGPGADGGSSLPRREATRVMGRP